MKYKLLFLILFCTIIAWCWKKTTSIHDIPSKMTKKVRELSTIEKVAHNLDQYSGEITYSTGMYWTYLNIPYPSWTWEFLSAEWSWNLWSLIISDQYNWQETIHETIMVTWWRLLYKDIFSIKIPSHTLWRWGILYEGKTTLNGIFINPTGHEDVMEPKWVSIVMGDISSLTWDICNPYDLIHFTKEYWNMMEKKWYFSTKKKNIEQRETTVSYEKKRYSDEPDALSLWWFTSRVGTHCFIKDNKRYKITIGLKEKKDVDIILNSFQFLK